MTVRERILALHLLEKQERVPDYMEKIGVRLTLAERERAGKAPGAPVRPCGEKDAEGNARNGTEKIRLAFARRILWCKRWDLNPHGGCHTHLKRACLPIPTLLQLRAVPNSLPIIPFFHPVVNSFFPLWREIPPETGKQNPKGSRGEIILDLWFRGWYSYSNPGKNRTFPKSSPA